MLTLNAVIAFIVPSAAAATTAFWLAPPLIGLSGMVLFYLAFRLPRWMRTLWRQAEIDAIGAAQLQLMVAATPAQVAAIMVPPLANIIGGSGVAVLDARCEPLAVQGLTADDLAVMCAISADTGAPGTPTRHATGNGSGLLIVVLAQTRLAVKYNGITPSIGGDETALLTSIGYMTDAAVQRTLLLDKERAARTAAEAADRALESSGVALAAARDTALEAAPILTLAPVPSSASHGRLLLVEDNAINQKVATRTLQRMGYEVEVAADGQQALDVLKTSTFDAILMDCQMPVMDGYDATEAVRRQERAGRRTPIIAMTASAMLSDRERCMAAGMDDYVSKPVRAGHLATVLRRWIDAPASLPAMDEERHVGQPV